MKFFFNNYKAIFHTITIAMIFTMFYFAGFEVEMKNFFFDVFLLIIAYFVSNFSLRKSGLDEEAEKYFKEQEQKKGDN